MAGEPKRFEVGATGVFVAGGERQWFGVNDATGAGLVLLTDLAEGAGAEVLGELELRAFRGEGGRDRADIDAYRSAAGRPYPRVYRARLVVELEELPDDEANAWWMGGGGNDLG